MADIKLGEPFGLDPDWVSKIDWDLSVSRIRQDLRSDFIYAPHLNYIYVKAHDELKEDLAGELKNGKFNPGVPLTIEVPKSHRMRIAVSSRRFGPAYSRPGSILLPKDRLLYQALSDQAAPIVAAKTDTARSFSHRLPDKDSATMFLPTRTCWNRLQKALGIYAKDKSIGYVLKLDVANFFGSLNQHTLINLLSDSGYPKALHSRLEAMLTSYTGDRSSRGILQGMYPSDLFGNYYLAPVDQLLDDCGVKSARYVDDLYVFVENVEAADRLLRQLIPTLRSYDLVLNEAKSVIMPKAALLTEEPDLEALFSAAVEEIAGQIDEDDFDADYGFQSEWDDDSEEEDLELQATMLLFDSLFEYPGHEESIERFCQQCASHVEHDGTKPYSWESTAGAMAVKRDGPTHKVVLTSFGALLPNNPLLSQPIGIEGALDWLMKRREEVNYTNPRFSEPNVPAHLDLIARTGVRKSVSAYLRDNSFLYAFDPQHAILAFPIETLKMALKSKTTGGAGITLVESDRKYLASLYVDKTGPLAEVVNLIRA